MTTFSRDDCTGACILQSLEQLTCLVTAGAVHNLRLPFPCHGGPAADAVHCARVLPGRQATRGGWSCQGCPPTGDSQRPQCRLWPHRCAAPPCSITHHELYKYYTSASKGHAKVLQHLIVSRPMATTHHQRTSFYPAETQEGNSGAPKLCSLRPKHHVGPGVCKAGSSSACHILHDCTSWSQSTKSSTGHACRAEKPLSHP